MRYRLVVLLVCSQSSTELQSIVPQGIELHDIARTRHNGTTVGRGIHPRHSLVATVGVKQSVLVEAEIRVTTLLDILYDILYQLTVSLKALFLSGILHVLLHSPDGPKGHVGLFDLVDLHRQGLAVHKLTKSLLGSPHHQFKIVALADGQRQAGHGNKRVTGTALEPRIAGQQITFVLLVNLLHSSTTAITEVELVGSRHQTVIEVITGYTVVHFLVEELLQR